MHTKPVTVINNENQHPHVITQQDLLAYTFTSSVSTTADESDLLNSLSELSQHFKTLLNSHNELDQSSKFDLKLNQKRVE